MNNHHNTDCYTTPSISILGSLAELTKGNVVKPTSSAWDNSEYGQTK